MKKILFAALASCFALNAVAAVHTYQFEATVSMIGDYNTYTFLQSTAGELPGTSLTIGDRIAGRFSYDTESPLAWSYPWSRTFDSAGRQNSLVFTDLPSAFTNAHLPTAGLTMEDDSWGRYLSITAGSFYLNFFDSSKTVLIMDHLPDQLSLGNLQAGIGSSFNRDADGHFIITSAQLTSLNEVSAVPEPESYAMLLTGLAIVSAVLRRTRAARS
jgi:hypothetical protein